MKTIPPVKAIQIVGLTAGFIAACTSLPERCSIESKDACGRLRRVEAMRAHEVEFREDDPPAPISVLLESRASAGGAFRASNLREQLPANVLASKSPIVVVDLRQESHVMIDDRSWSWTGYRNWSNAGLSFSEVLADEYGKIEALSRGKKGRKRTDVRTERAAVEAQGWRYVRLPVTEDLHPSDEELDRWITALRLMPEDAHWHYHDGGSGHRATVMLALHGMIRNARHDPMEKILRRVLEASPHPEAFRIPSADDWRIPYRQAQRNFLEVFYDYAVQHPSGRGSLWTEWKRRIH